MRLRLRVAFVVFVIFLKCLFDLMNLSKSRPERVMMNQGLCSLVGKLLC